MWIRIGIYKYIYIMSTYQLLLDEPNGSWRVETGMVVKVRTARDLSKVGSD